MPQFKIVRVTTTQDYALPINPNGSTYNGQSVEELVEQWFNSSSLNRLHMSRDGSRVGGSIEMVSVKVIEETISS